MDKSINQAINNFIIKAAELDSRLVTAYLFGSFAKDRETDESDIDIAFVINNLRDDERFDLQVKLMLLASEFDSRIEPHPLSDNEFDSGNPFATEIKKTGIEIRPQTIRIQ
ncbi:MAG: nucleotidyltransferase domain-containing protein [Spirochaetes bacterium]|nr:nucleotidyltransferase domain-containing protein [Spirochaetota bacterium]